VPTDPAMACDDAIKNAGIFFESKQVMLIDLVLERNKKFNFIWIITYSFNREAHKIWLGDVMEPHFLIHLMIILNSSLDKAFHLLCIAASPHILNPFVTPTESTLIIALVTF
jgi:hypothetical protein